LLDETHTVGSKVQPAEREFEIFTAGTYDVVVTDLAVPAAAVAGSVHAAITRGSQVLKLVDAGTAASFAATPGIYGIRIIGSPDASKGIATIGAKVSLAGGAVAVDFSDTLQALDADPSSNPRVLDTSVDLTAGDYDVALVDRNLPSALSSLTLAIVKQGGSALALQLPAAGNGSFTATTGTYRLFVIGQSPAAINAGAYSVTLRARAGGALVFSQTSPVGRTLRLATVTLLAGDHSLVVNDLGSPAPLAKLVTLVVRGGESAASLTSGGTATFTATAGTYELLAAATAAAGTAGSYAVRLLRSGAEVFTAAHGIADIASGIVPYEFTADSAAAGTYQLRIGDFQFPQALTSLRALLTQGGAVVGSLASAGQVDVPLVASRATALVFAQTTAAASGIFGISLQPSTPGATLIEATQGVGATFAARKVSITNTGTFDATLADLAFPAAFTELAAVVTRGTVRVGSIFGGGTFAFDATAGNYFINFIAKPNSTPGFGSYRILVASRPPAPTVSLSADSVTVTSGSTARLTWSATNAASCSASGSWSGSKATSGNEVTAAITSSATFVLECTGAGGNAKTQVVVTPQAASSSGGGGGSLTVESLVALLVLLLYAHRMRNA
jgi:hypothetical protein